MSSFGPISGEEPWRLRWSEIATSRPGWSERIDRAAGVREHEAADPEPAEDAHAEDDLRRRMPLVQVRAALHHRHRGAAEVTEDERAAVTDRRRPRPARDLAVRDLDRFLDGVREAPEPAPEHDPDGRLHVGLRPDRCEGLPEVVAQVEPSSRREPITATIRSTASAGSSVRYSRSRSPGETYPSASISSRSHSTISSQ